MQAGNCDPAAEAGRKAGHRCRRAKGRIGKRASTGTGNADAHRRYDPRPGKTGCGELRAHVSLSPDAMFWPCMPVGEQAGQRVTWNHFYWTPNPPGCP